MTLPILCVSNGFFGGYATTCVYEILMTKTVLYIVKVCLSPTPPCYFLCLMFTLYSILYFSILFSFSVLKIGFVSPVYSASEGLANVTVCIEVKEGSLSITPNLSLSTYNHTAGICLHMIHDS